MNQEQQREAIRLLRVVAASSMANTHYGHQEEWIGWQRGEQEGVRNLKRDTRALLDSLYAADRREK